MVLSSIKALDKVFCHYIAHGFLLEKAAGSETDGEKRVREWSRERYVEFQERLLGLMAAEQISVQEQSLVALMHLMEKEGLHPTTKVEGKPNQFPLDLLEVMINYLLDLLVIDDPVLLGFC